MSVSLSAWERPKVVYVVTHSMSAGVLLEGQLRFVRNQGFDVVVICAPGPHTVAVAEREGVSVVTVPMSRAMSPLKDCVSLCRIYLALKRARPTIVNASTPKAALLGTVASWAVRVPVRVYNLRGLRLQETTGGRRWLLSVAERATAGLSHRILCISESLRQTYLDLGFASEAKITVLGAGSSNGVDHTRFAPTPERRREAQVLRARLGIEPGVAVIGFVGRLVRDKGIEDLLVAFDRLRAGGTDCRLLVLGDFEGGDPLPAGVVERMRRDPLITMPGFVSDPAPYYGLMDVLAFPSRREGFGNVALEAAAAEVPVVGFRVTGVVDAVQDGVTGTLVAPGDAGALTEALSRYLRDPELRREHGTAGAIRAARDFGREDLWAAIVGEYRTLLRERMKSPGRFADVVGESAPGVVRHPPRAWEIAKRAMDIGIASTALVVLTPVLVVVAILVLLSSGPPVLFRQLRIGRGGRPFELLKFRTMRPPRGGEAAIGSEDARMTEVGRFLRRASLDELPQLVNVLKGDMSLVGPRPLLPEYLPRYSAEQARRHEVQPGLTGPVQVGGRNALSWDDRFALDVWYVDNRCLTLDLKILLLTVKAVLSGRGAQGESSASGEFLGSATSVEPGRCDS